MGTIVTTFGCSCQMNENIPSQSYNETMSYFDNSSFPEHVLNQLFLSNERSVSQAYYYIIVLTIYFQLFEKAKAIHPAAGPIRPLFTRLPG